MTGYKLEVERDGNLGIYSQFGGCQSEVWIGNILEPESPNPVLVLGTPLGLLGVRRILDLFKKWQAGPRAASGTRQPSPRLVRCRRGTRKWRKALHAEQ
jgi:hypothetical protein